MPVQVFRCPSEKREFVLQGEENLIVPLWPTEVNAPETFRTDERFPPAFVEVISGNAPNVGDSRKA